MSDRDKNVQSLVSKKCPECFTYLPLNAKICTSCKVKVGKAGKDGIAEKATDWLAYLLCLAAWFLFGYYIWWAFIKS